MRSYGRNFGIFLTVVFVCICFVLSACSVSVTEIKPVNEDSDYDKSEKRTDTALSNIINIEILSTEAVSDEASTEAFDENPDDFEEGFMELVPYAPTGMIAQTETTAFSWGEPVPQDADIYMLHTKK